MIEDTLRKQLYGSFKNRAMMYWHIFEALKIEVSEQKATEIIKRGIYNRGLENKASGRLFMIMTNKKS